MDTFADLSADRAEDRSAHALRSCATKDGDVPGISVGQICETYAAEELRRRHERTEIMIARALEQA